MASENSKIIVYSDGGCRTNPGPGAWSYVIQFPDGRKVTGGGYVEHATNNQLEYEALSQAAAFLGAIQQDLGPAIEFRSDSMLCVEQLNGNWAVKEPSLLLIYNQALYRIAKLMVRCPSVTLVHIPRAQNEEADQICGRIQDEHGVVGKPNPKKVRA